MFAFRTFTVCAIALSTAVLAAFEPLNAQDMFARSPAQFEPLDESPSVTRRHALPGQYLPKAHGVVARGVSAALSRDVNSALQQAHSQLTPVASQVSSICSGSSKSTSSGHIIGQLTPHLTKCKQVVSDCGGQVSEFHHHPKPHPSKGSGGGGWPGSGGCSSSLAELIELIEELLGDILALVEKIPQLESFFKDYVDSLDSELAQLVTTTDSAVSGVAATLKSTTTSLQSSLHNVGLHNLVSTIVGA